MNFYVSIGCILNNYVLCNLSYYTCGICSINDLFYQAIEHCAIFNVDQVIHRLTTLWLCDVYNQSFATLRLSDENALC